MKQIIRNSLKVIISFIMGGFLFSSITYSATLVSSDQVSYVDNTTVKVKLDDLYAKCPYITTGPNKIDSENYTHKGIVYLDPTDLTKTCNAKNSVSTTGTKTGCMKWYIFDDSGDNYTMLLDHNTTPCIAWSSTNAITEYANSLVKPLVDDLVTTSKWKVTPRIITAAEVNNLVPGNTGSWSASSYSKWYRFGSRNQTKYASLSDAQKRVQQRMYWLFDNMSESASAGAITSDTKSYTYYGTSNTCKSWGYWTSTPTNSKYNNIYQHWDVGSSGSLNHESVNDNTYSLGNGIRPVITISKSIVH